VADDPEFEWNETIRRSRVSHEARQTLLYLLDCFVRRRMCKTVLEMGGNTVLGYHQNFDVEGDSGIVARTYGTCVLLEKKRNMQLRASTSASSSPANHEMQLTNQDRIEGLDLMMLDSMPPSPSAPDSAAGLSNRLLLSDALLSDAAAAVVARHRENSDEDEVKLLTLREFDSNVRVRFCGMVTARSVKYLGNLRPSSRIKRLVTVGGPSSATNFVPTPKFCAALISLAILRLLRSTTMWQSSP
jgi:hypothetical protein